MMLLGFAGFGFMAYRRTKKSAAVWSIAARATQYVQFRFWVKANPPRLNHRTSDTIPFLLAGMLSASRKRFRK
jgi:hypothetical protein